MEIKNNTVRRAIKKKFINPLRDGCNYNVNKLNIEQKVKHKETINLLTQANDTLINVENNLNNLKIVDANVLLRAAFEYILMGMMIQFDNGVYNEFVSLGVERDKTRINKIISKFRTHMNEICEDLYKDFNREEKLEMLTELYDKMCNYTHSTLLVSTMIEINNTKEKEIFKLLAYQNYYFLKLLLFLCLKYFTNDQTHYLETQNIGFTYLFLIAEIGWKINNYKIDFSRYNDLLYYDKNIKYFEKEKKSSNKLKEELIQFNEHLKDNNDKFVEELEAFLS